MPTPCNSRISPGPLSLTANAYSTCDYPHCAPYFGVPPQDSSLDVPFPIAVTSAKYLGSFISPTSSSNPDVNFRCSQASSAFKHLDPFFRHPLISRKKLRMYSHIVQSILLHGSESHVYSPAQITKIDSLHYKALRQFLFCIKSPYFHRVLSPSDSPCWNDFLLSVAYPILPTCIPSSMRISDSRLGYL